MKFLERVKGYLLGGTIVDVEEYENDEETGIVLVLDTGKKVKVGVAYEEVDLVITTQSE